MSADAPAPLIHRLQILLVWMLAGFVWLAIMGIRMSSLLTIGLLAVLYVTRPLYRRRWPMRAAGILYALSLLIPVDISLGSSIDPMYVNRVYHSHHSGLRFVRCFGTCQTGHTALRTQYGEYGTHAANSPFRPRWLLLWD